MLSIEREPKFETFHRLAFIHIGRKFFNLILFSPKKNTRYIFRINAFVFGQANKEFHIQQIATKKKTFAENERKIALNSRRQALQTIFRVHKRFYFYNTT
jgi:hypothetical protein